MQANIRGDEITAFIFLLMGTSFLYILPWSLRRKIRRGDINYTEGESWLRNAPVFGLSMILISMFLSAGVLIAKGLFGYSGVRTAVMIALSVVMIVISIWQRRRMNE
jgi:hypothetical protein